MPERSIQQVVDYIPFVKTWIGKPKPQIIEEMASMQMETERIPDPYKFTVRNDGKLISPETGKLVEKSILVRNKVEELEFDAFLIMQNICNVHTSGTIVWISPPSRDYSSAKIIISEILEENGQKVLFNRAILTKHTHKDCVDIANDVSSQTIKPDHYFHEQEVRSLPIYLETGLDWKKTLEPYIDEEVINMINNSNDIINKGVALEKASVIYEKVIKRAGTVGCDSYEIKTIIGNSFKSFLGSHSLSCPVTGRSASEVLIGSAIVMGTELDCTCPNCKQRVKAKIFNGTINCPNCKTSALYRC